MRKRIVLYGVWLVTAGLLYFFENNAGTRIVLAASLLLPALPAARRALFGPDEPPARPGTAPRSVRDFALREDEDPAGVRSWLPGDPVSQIHWKLSARWDELLTRDRPRAAVPESETRPAESPADTPARVSKKRVLGTGFLLLAAVLLLLFALPSARLGAQALMNRLFTASEAVNAYAYARFPVPADQPVLFASILLALIPALLLAMTLLSGSRAAALCLMAGCAAFQIYFGLSFPAWVNVPLFALFALWMLRRPRTGRAVLSVLVCVSALALALSLCWPGVDAATESASERARDWLSETASRITGMVLETPAGETETRHAHIQSLTDGDLEAQTDRAFRLVDVEERQVSRPRRIDWLRIILLLLLTVLLVTVPFLPFWLLNRRRKKARELREFFASGNVNDAVPAIFQQVVSRLDAADCGCGNLLYAEWAPFLSDRISPDYGALFARCADLFQTAAYSAHSLSEDDRREALTLLDRTREQTAARGSRLRRMLLRFAEGGE